jgi:tetratricopeptide (TPR) repeat protein
MRISRLGVFVLIAITVFFATSCGYYNQIIARKNLVDGSNAYKGRKFPEAQQLFRDAVALDPEGKTLEGKTAQLFLARTIHSEYIGDRKNNEKAELAITEYQKALSFNPNDQSSYKAIASLYENLQQNDKWLAWVTARANNKSIPPEQQAEALTSLAARKNSCANDITDTEATKKTIQKDGKPSFQFVKPASPEDFASLGTCIQEGTTLIDQALALEVPAVKNAASLDIKGMSDGDLVKNLDLLKVFESARSYKASLLIQGMRLAEMDNRVPDRDRLKGESDAARKSFLDLSDVVKKIQTEIDDRKAAIAAAAPGGSGSKNANANAK